MKKFNYFMMAALLIVGVSSCEKDEMDANPITSLDGTEQRIVDFKAAVQMKSTQGLDMEVDSLIWYAEAAMNMSYGHLHLAYDGRRTDSLLVTVDLADGCTVSGENVVDAYITMHNFIASQFANYKADNKHIIVIDIRKEGANDEAAGFWIYSTVGSVFEDGNLKSSTPFNHEYDWYHCFEKRRCNGYQETNPAYFNAADRLSVYSTSFVGLGNSSRYFYTDVQNKWVDDPSRYPNNDSETNEQYPYLMYESDRWQRTCLSPADMSFLYNSLHTIVSSVSEESGDKEPCYLNCVAAAAVGREYIIHIYEFKVGIKHVRETPPPDDPILMGL